MEAGEGEEGRDCLLETQEESQRQASPARAPPPQLFLKFGSLPTPGAHQGAATKPRAWHARTSLRPALPDLLPEGALVWPGCCPLATGRRTQSPSASERWGVWSGS